MWTSQPEQQAQAYSFKRVGFWADPRGYGGFMTYTENATLAQITAGLGAQTSLADEEIKSFIEKQRSPDYTTTTVAGAGILCFVLANDGAETWTLYLNASNQVVKGAAAFTIS